jgi:threonine/homoserine/homoserine lactone efflux protein
MVGPSGPLRGHLPMNGEENPPVFSLLLRGYVLGFAVAASPGPIFFLCVRRTIVQGRLAGLFSGLGVATADGFYAAIATFGVTVVITAFAGGRRPLAVVGGVILVALGASILMARGREAVAASAPNGRGLAWAYVSTLGLTITNVATIVSFAALAATLGVGTRGSLVRPSLVVAGVLLGSATWWCVLVIGASMLRARVTPGVVRGISTFSGLVIAVLGILAVLSAFSG